MPDMLVRLYALPDPAPYDARAAASGIAVRRMEAWDRDIVRRFVREQFSDNWAAEVEFAFSNGHPITGFVAVKDGDIIGFAAYECSRRGFFGPTGVREDLRNSGAGALLLMRCLESMREMGYAYAIIGGVGRPRSTRRCVAPRSSRAAIPACTRRSTPRPGRRPRVSSAPSSTRLPCYHGA